jgi:hypothetical protein
MNSLRDRLVVCVASMSPLDRAGLFMGTVLLAVLLAFYVELLQGAVVRGEQFREAQRLAPSRAASKGLATKAATEAVPARRPALPSARLS